MLDTSLAGQLKSLLERLTAPIELVSSLDDGPKSAELAELLTEIAAMSDKITYSRADDDARRPSFAIRRTGTDVEVRFAGIPLGHEFSSLALALLQVGGYPSKEAAELLEQVRALDVDLHFETYFSLSCQNCPDVVQALNLMAILNPRISHVAIDGALFKDEVEQRKVLAVPTVFLNGESFDSGRMTLEQIIGKVDTGAAQRTAEAITEKDPFDVLVVGGGPAGRRPQSTLPAREFALVWSPSGSAVRCSTPWRSRTTSPFRTPRDRSTPRHWKPTSASTTST